MNGQKQLDEISHALHSHHTYIHTSTHNRKRAHMHTRTHTRTHKHITIVIQRNA